MPQRAEVQYNRNSNRLVEKHPHACVCAAEQQIRSVWSRHLRVGCGRRPSAWGISWCGRHFSCVMCPVSLICLCGGRWPMAAALSGLLCGLCICWCLLVLVLLARTGTRTRWPITNYQPPQQPPPPPTTTVQRQRSAGLSRESALALGSGAPSAAQRPARPRHEEEEEEEERGRLRFHVPVPQSSVPVPVLSVTSLCPASRQPPRPLSQQSTAPAHITMHWVSGCSTYIGPPNSPIQRPKSIRCAQYECCK
jgi:hypothetical protein